jgi:hypothetical protein
MSNPDMPSTDRRLDGNALAGPLSELFAIDLVGATGTCAGCGSTSPLGEQLLYADAPAVVLRCRGCAGVLLRYGVDESHVRLEMSGLQLLVASVAPARAPKDVGRGGVVT